MTPSSDQQVFPYQCIITMKIICHCTAPPTSQPTIFLSLDNLEDNNLVQEHVNGLASFEVDELVQQHNYVVSQMTEQDDKVSEGADESFTLNESKRSLLTVMRGKEIYRS